MKRFFRMLGLFLVAAAIAITIHFFQGHVLTFEHGTTEHKAIRWLHLNPKRPPHSSSSIAQSPANIKRKLDSSVSVAVPTKATTSGIHDKEANELHDSSIKKTFLAEMDMTRLTSLVLDRQVSEEIRHQAANILLDRIREERDRNQALQVLIDVKEAIGGEDQQFVLKALHNLADLGGNEAIVDTFFQSGTDTVNRFRMLTYLNPRFPLGEDTSDRLADAYFQDPDGELAPALLQTMATACGEQGVSWLIDRTSLQEGSEEWNTLIDVLSRSGSELAFDYLHKLANTMENPGRKEHIRHAILHLKSQLPEKFDKS